MSGLQRKPNAPILEAKSDGFFRTRTDPFVFEPPSSTFFFSSDLRRRRFFFMFLFQNSSRPPSNLVSALDLCVLKRKTSRHSVEKRRVERGPRRGKGKAELMVLLLFFSLPPAPLLLSSPAALAREKKKKGFCCLFSPSRLAIHPRSDS